jgi:hypothetical protein
MPTIKLVASFLAVAAWVIARCHDGPFLFRRGGGTKPPKGS